MQSALAYFNVHTLNKIKPIPSKFSFVTFSKILYDNDM